MSQLSEMGFGLQTHADVSAMRGVEGARDPGCALGSGFRAQRFRVRGLGFRVRDFRKRV